MRFSVLRSALLISALLPLLFSSTRAQEFPNRASLEIHGLIVKGMIDRFEYGPNDRIHARYVVTNPTNEAITVSAGGTCAMLAWDGTWCQPSGTECITSPRSTVACIVSQSVTFGPGDRIINSVTFAPPRQQPGDGIELKSGRIFFLDPWGLSGFAFFVNYTFDPTTVAVTNETWAKVKSLYAR